METNKFLEKNSRKIILVVCIAIIITVILILWNILKQPKFEVKDFSMNAETTEYTTIANYTKYEGKGNITASNPKGTYLVALRVKLKAGGNEETRNEYITTVMVYDGKGEFSTYDSGEVGKITEPKYEFEIIGSVKF